MVYETKGACRKTVRLDSYIIVMFISLNSPHPVSPHLNWPHFIWTKCAVIGHSHGKLGHVLLSDPTQFATTITNHGTLSSDEW